MKDSSNPSEKWNAMIAALRASRSGKHGSDGVLWYRTVPYALVLLACCTTLFALVGVPLILAVPLAAGLTAAFIWAGITFGTAAAEAFGRMVLPTGDSTPYEHQFSHEDSLAARGDIAGAIESLEAAIAVTPLTALTGVNVRIRAAELHMGKGGDPKRAAELFREIQRFPGASPSQDTYVSNRLIDLLLGPLRQRSRALVELRRIADRYPDSSAATHARAAIARLKRELEDEANREQR